MADEMRLSDIMQYIKGAQSQYEEQGPVAPYTRAAMPSMDTALGATMPGAAKGEPPAGGKRYQIIDRQTGQPVGETYGHKGRARTRADKLDNEYGAYRYYVKPVDAPPSPEVAE